MSESTTMLLQEMLHKYEGEVRDEQGNHKPYRDQAGVLTIGYGHTGTDFDENTRWTDEQANGAFKLDTKTATDAYDRLVTVDLTSNQKAAVLSLIYNVGEGAFGNSKALKHLNNGNFEEYLKEANDPDIGFTKTRDPKTGVKRKNKGLINRRRAEGEMFSRDPKEVAEDLLEVAPAAPAAPEPKTAREALGMDQAVAAFTPKIPEPKLPRFTGQPVDAPVPVNIEEPQRASTFSARDAVEQQAAAKNKQSASFWELAKASGRVDNTLGNRVADESQYKIDQNYDPKQFWKDNQTRLEAMQGMDAEEAAEQFASAVSSDHAEERLRKIESDFADEQLLMDNTMKAIIPRLALSIADPIDIGITVATVPISGGASAAYKVGRLGKILTGAMIAGTATGTTEAVLARNNAFRDETDVMMATLAGFTLGGAFSSLSKSQNGRIQEIVNDVANGEVDSAAAKLGVDSAGARRVAHGSEGTPNKPLQSDQKGATLDEILGDMDDPKFRFKRVQQALGNFQATLFHSKTGKVRKLASKMLEGGFLKGKGTRGFTAEGRAQHVRRVFETGIFQQSLPAFKQWAERNGHSNPRRLFSTSTGEEFYSEVGRAMRGEVAGLSEEAVSAAAKMRPFMDNMFDLAEAAGVKGFDKEALTDYFPRMIHKGKFNSMVQKVGTKGMEKWYREAILSANEELGEDLAEKIARGYVHTMRHKAAGLEADLLNGIRLDDVEKLREVFEGYDGIDEIISELENLKLKEQGERGTVSHGKRRITFDENYSAPMRDHDGNEFNVKFSELLENDARKVLKRYGQIMSGHIGMAKELGIRSRSQFDEVKATIISDAEKAGGDLDIAAKEVQALDESYNLLLGQTIEPNPQGLASQLARTGTALTYTTRGGQFGVNALAEIGNIVGSAGVRAFVRSIPEWASMMKRAADGTLDHDLARTAELLFAPGIHTLTGHAIKNMDELGEGFEQGGKMGAAMRAADPYLKSGGRFMSIASGLSGITDITQRIAGVEYLRKIARFANGEKISKGQAERLRAAGLSDAMQKRIFKMMRPEKMELVDEADHALKGTAEDVKFVENYFDGPVVDELPPVVKGLHVTRAPKDAVLEPRIPDSPQGPQPEGLYFSLDAETVNTYRSRATGDGKLNVREMEVETKDLLDITSQTSKEGRGDLSYGDAKKAALDEARAQGYKGTIERGNPYVAPELAVFDTSAIVSGNARATKKAVNTGGAGVYKNGRLVDLDVEKWADEEALDALNMASHRELRNIIQENDISTVTKYFHHPLGRVLMQFMRFPMEAVNKQLLRGVHHADAETMKSWLASYLIGTTVYMAQQSIEYANDPKTRKERLTTQNVAAAGFMRTGFSSMLPPVIDNLAAVTGQDPLFAHGRSSGLGTQLHKSSPLIATVSKLGSGTAAITRSLLNDDIQFSQGDFRNMAQAIPGQRLLGFKNAIHAVEEMFPEKRDQ
jgi:GH24 family phage-related lysozyme (muramidase)